MKKQPDIPPEPVPTALAALLEQHAGFRRFLSARLGSQADADDVLQGSLLRVMERGVSLRRGERAVAWFYRVLRNAIADHYRGKAVEHRKAKWLETERGLDLDTTGELTPEWEATICTCFHGLLPRLKQRYALLIQRVDLRGEPKVIVAHDLKLSRAAFDVVLHRARQSLRREIQILCAACSEGGCLTCSCLPENSQKKPRRTERKSE